MFKEKKYLVIKNIIKPELCSFLFRYMILKKRVVTKMINDGYISSFEEAFGGIGDEQIPNTFQCYAEIAMEQLLLDFLPIMEKKTKLNLIPNYSYIRVYKKGDELKRHKDREECQISTTLNLGGDPWPIYVSPNENVGIPESKKNITAASNAKGVKVNLSSGDMLVYRGVELEHWRKPFEGEVCVQVFLHYNDKDVTIGKKYDNRPFIGLPSWFKGRK
jgi:hypothetical protein